MSDCPLHPDGSPTRPAWDEDQCVTCFRLAGGVLPKAGRVRTARRPLPVCPHLGAEAVRVPGSQKAWRRCGAGYGSTTPDARAGLVCLCGTPTPGVWRQGKECGPACPGYPPAA